MTGKNKLLLASVCLVSFLLGIGLHVGITVGGEGHAHSMHGEGDAQSHEHSHETGAPESGWSNSPIQTELANTKGDLRNFPSDFRSDRYLVNFWATWCPPCVHELPLLSEYHTAGEVESGVEVLGIAIDDAGKVRSFVERVPLSFESLVAGPNAFDMLPRQKGEPPYLPASYLVDTEGNVLAQKSGPFADIAEIKEFVSALESR